MIRVVLADEDYGSIGEDQNAFLQGADGDFDECLGFDRTLALIDCQYIFIVNLTPRMVR
jgi:hypothetical protein